MGLADRDYMRDRARVRASRNLPIYRSEGLYQPAFTQKRLLAIASVAVVMISGLGQKIMTFAWVEYLKIAASVDDPVTRAAQSAAYKTPAAIAHALYPIAALALLLIGVRFEERHSNSRFYDLIKNYDLCRIFGAALAIIGSFSLVSYYKTWERENFAPPAKAVSAVSPPMSGRTSGGVEMYLPMQGNISRMLFQNSSSDDVAVTLRYTLQGSNLKKQAAKLYVGAGRVEGIDIPSFVYEVSVERFAPNGQFSNAYGLNNMRSMTFRNPVDLIMPASSFSDYPSLTLDNNGDLFIRPGRLKQLPSGPHF